MADNKTLGAAVAGALVVGGLATSLVSGGKNDAPTTLESIPAGIVNKDTGSAAPTPEPVGPLTTDIDSPLAKPGEEVVSVVVLRKGWKPTSGFTLTGDAVGKFRVIASQMVGNMLKVKAENTSNVAAKFSATFQYDKAP